MPAVSLTVNGKHVTAEVEGRTLLVQLLREKLHLTGITGITVTVHSIPIRSHVRVQGIAQRQ